jgi:hypothetical protein
MIQPELARAYPSHQLQDVFKIQQSKSLQSHELAIMTTMAMGQVIDLTGDEVSVSPWH